MEKTSPNLLAINSKNDIVLNTTVNPYNASSGIISKYRNKHFAIESSNNYRGHHIKKYHKRNISSNNYNDIPNNIRKRSNSSIKEHQTTLLKQSTKF